LTLAYGSSAHAGDGETKASGSVSLDSGQLDAKGSASGRGEAQQGKHRIRFEGGAGILVGPQADRFNTLGGGGALAYEFRFLPYLAIEPRYTLYGFSLDDSDGGPTGRSFAQMAGAHLRLYPTPKAKLGQLWLGAGPEMVFIASGPDSIRAGLSAGTGFEFNANWLMAIGPFLRYSHIVQPNDATSGPQDAQFFQAGLSLAFGGKRPATEDQDGDGIADREDACVGVAEDFDSYQDLDGCPETDNDRDGVPDPQDACPLEPGVASDLPSANGCPAVDLDLDLDEDGIANEVDECPDQAEDMDGFEDEDGCPDLDADRDKILDPTDLCPDEAETVNGFQDEDGCPDEVPDDTAVSSLRVLQELGEPIYFETKASTLSPEGRQTLERLANMMASHPEIGMIRIEGYAGAEGSRASSQTLSEERAETIRRELVRIGVNPTRLQTRGYGQRKLQVSTQAGNGNNRRAIFRVMMVRTPVGP